MRLDSGILATMWYFSYLFVVGCEGQQRLIYDRLNPYCEFRHYSFFYIYMSWEDVGQ